MCCLLLTVANLITIAFYDEPAPLITARFAVGLAHGALYVALIAHTGENSCAELRGGSVAALGCAQACAAATTLLVSLQVVEYSSIDSNQFVGLVSVLGAWLGAAWTWRHAHESVVYRLQRGHADAEVAATLCRLRNEAQLTVAVANELAELRGHLEHERRSGWGASPLHAGNWRPLLAALALRSMHSCTDNVLLNAVQTDWMRAMWPAGGPGGAALMVAAVRAVGALGPRVLLDRLGRKPHVAVVACGAGVMVVLAVVLRAVPDVRGMAGLLALVAAVHALYGLGGADALVHVTVAEAFALCKKPWSVAVVAGWGHAAHVAWTVVWLAVPATRGLGAAMLYGPAAVVMVVAAVLVWRMPETRAMSLRQCRDEWVGRGGGVVAYTREGRAERAQEEGITYSA